MKRVMVAVIDMQVGFVNRWTRGLPERILKFLEAVSVAGPLVIGTRYVNHPGTACYVFEGWTACMAGTAQAEFLPELAERTERIFDKDRYSFWNDAMREFVRANRVEKIYFVGVNTGCCVLHSAFDCYNDLTDCAVIADLCGSTSGVQEHEAALTVLRSCITKERVVCAAQAAQEILALESGRPSYNE